MDNHPDLLVLPEELHFFKNVLFAKDKKKAVLEKTGFRLLLDKNYIKNWSTGKSWYKNGYPNFNRNLFRNQINAIDFKKLGAKDLLISLVEAFGKSINSSELASKYWVTKTTQNEIFTHILNEMFNKEGYFFYYIVRDPRDVFLSYSQRMAITIENSLNNNDLLKEFIALWKTQIRQALRFEKTIANFHIIRYEDIIRNTEATISTVTNEIEIPFNSSLLIPTRLGNRWQGNSVFTKRFDYLSAEPIGRYKKMLSKSIQCFIEFRLSNELKEFNYEIKKDCSNFKIPLQGSISSHLWGLIALIKYFIKKNLFLLRYKTAIK